MDGLRCGRRRASNTEKGTKAAETATWGRFNGLPEGPGLSARMRAGTG